MRKSIITMIICLLITASCLVAGTFAWLGLDQNTIVTRISGKLVTEYFHCGSGTADDPFVITRPIHYYHMVEFFQRLTNLPVVIHSTSNETVVKFGEEYLYFQIGCPEEQLYNPELRPETDENTEYYVFRYDSFGILETETAGGYERGKKSTDLNMAYYSGDLSIMPIGSSSVPFVGQLDGKGLTVSNLSIVTTSDVEVHTYDNSGNVTSTSTVTRKTCDVGIFGFIGAGGVPNGETESVTTAVKNVYFNNVTIDLSGLDASAITSEVEGQTHTNNTNVHNSETCYAGYIAGHLTLSSLVQNVYVNDATFIGGDAATIGFGYFGCVEDSNGVPVTNLGSEVSTLRARGDDAGFGGSIDMKKIHARLYDIWNNYASSPSTYVNSQTVRVDNVDHTITIDSPEGTTTMTFDTENGQTFRYRVYETEKAGKYFYYNYSNTSGNQTTHNFNTLYGEGSRYSKTVTTYTYENEFSDAFYIHDGARYLSVSGTALSSVTSQSDAAKWLFDSQGHLYTNIDISGGSITKYYLNRSGTAGVTLGTSASTVWHYTSSNADSFTSELYLTDTGVNYYLDYNGGWVLTRYNEYYTIGDGQGHFISANNTSVQNVGSAANSVKWAISDTTGSTTTISTESNGTIRYLDGSDGTLKMSASSSTWNKDGNKYYVTIQNIRHYLVFDSDDNSWKVVPVSGKKITDGNGHFLTASTSAVGNATEASAVVWQFSNESGNTQIYTILNNQKYYLTVNNGALSVSTTARTWTRPNNSNSFYVTDNGKDYYLTYDGYSWTVTALEYFTINDGNGNYLRVTGANAFANGNSNNATHFYFATEDGSNSRGRAWCYVGSTTYYLYNNNGTLNTTTTQNTGTIWQNDGSSLYVTSGTTTYALEYNSDWHIKNLTGGYLISDGNGNYLTYNGSLGNTTNPATASRWTFSNTSGSNPSGYISTIYNNQTYYLRYNNGLTTTTNTNTNYRTSWSNNANNLYYSTGGNTYYIQMKNGAWNASTSTVIGYTVRYNTNYLNVTSTSGVGTGTSIADYNSNNNTVWFTTNDATDYGTIIPNGYFSTVINGETYYLYRNSTSTVTLSTTNQTLWRNYRGNNIYERVTSGNNTTYYNLNYSNGWNIVTGDNYSSLTTTSVNVSVTPGKSLVESVDTTRPTVLVTPETAGAPTVTINNFTSSGTTISVSDPQSEAVTFEKTQYQTVTKTIATARGGYQTYFPIRTAVSGDADYDSSDPYKASNKNTGYIISAANIEDTSESEFQKHAGDIRISYFPISSISGSYSTSGLTVTRIRQGNNYLYLQKQEDNTYLIANTTNENQANFWEYSNNKLSTTIGKTTYYLTYNNGLTLTTSADSAVQWTNNNNRFTYNNNNIRFNNGWVASNSTTNATLTLTTGTLNLNSIYTYDGSGNHLLRDEQKTDAFRQAALQLNQSLAGSNSVYGLHFMDSKITTDHLINAEYVSIFGQEYENYELPEDSIDFNVIERGTINFFAGEYFSNNNAFFSLHKVFRYKANDPEVVAGTKKANDIKDIKEISEVYKGPLGDRGNYIYRFSDGTYTDEDGEYTGSTTLASGYTSAFKTSWITAPSGMTSGGTKVYYFEIPCNEGEYCLGSVSGKTGAYLIYLDIAANGGDTIASAISSEGNDVTNTFSVEFRDEPDKMDHSVLMFSIDAPANSQDKVSVKTSFDKTANASPHQNGLYTIEIVNNSSEDLTLYVYLCDDDYNLMTQFQYAYQIKYTNASQTDEYVTTAVGNVFQMMAGFTIPATGTATEVTYH